MYLLDPNVVPAPGRPLVGVPLVGTHRSPMPHTATLAIARDKLLPKLVSGQARVGGLH